MVPLLNLTHPTRTICCSKGKHVWVITGVIGCGDRLRCGGGSSEAQCVYLVTAEAGGMARCMQQTPHPPPCRRPCARVEDAAHHGSHLMLDCCMCDLECFEAFTLKNGEPVYALTLA